MTAVNTRSPVTLGKIVIIVLGLVIMCVGLDSHFQSIWRKEKHHKICEFYDDYDEEKCPSISMEHYYVAMIIICFFLSLFNFVASFFINYSSTIKMADCGYHILSAVLLMIAAIVYFISVDQIHKLYGKKDPGNVLRRKEKIVAGFLTFLQAILYGVVGFFIIKS